MWKGFIIHEAETGWHWTAGSSWRFRPSTRRARLHRQDDKLTTNTEGVTVITAPGDVSSFNQHHDRWSWGVTLNMFSWLHLPNVVEQGDEVKQDERHDAKLKLRDFMIDERNKC